MAATTVLAEQSINLPSDTTGNRPGSPDVGMIRYNTTIASLEYYGNRGWNPIKTQGIVTNSLILHWDPSTYTAGTGNTWTDSVGSQTMTLYGNASAKSGSYVIGSASTTAGSWFSGGNYASAIFGTGAFTIEAWVYLSKTNFSSWRYIFGKSTFWDGGSYGMYLNSSGQSIGFHTTSGNGIEYSLSNIGTGWKHIVGVRTTGGRNLYIDGNIVASDSTVDNITTTANIVLGASSTGGGYNEITYKYGSYRIYNKALSTAEVRQNFTWEKPRYSS
jgi:hypothetical protein